MAGEAGEERLWHDPAVAMGIDSCLRHFSEVGVPLDDGYSVCGVITPVKPSRHRANRTGAPCPMSMRGGDAVVTRTPQDASPWSTPWPTADAGSSRRAGSTGARTPRPPGGPSRGWSPTAPRTSGKQGGRGRHTSPAVTHQLVKSPSHLDSRQPGRASMVERLVPDELWGLFQRAVPEAPTRPRGGGRRRHEDREVLAAVIMRVLKGGADRSRSRRPVRQGVKIHLITVRAGLPLSVAAPGANTRGSQALGPLVHGIPPIRSRRGPRRFRPAKLHGAARVMATTTCARRTGSSPRASSAGEGRGRPGRRRPRVSQGVTIPEK